MAGPTLRVRGLAETQRAFRAMDKEAGARVRADLRTLAAPIAAEAQTLLSRYPGLSVNTIRPKARIGGVVVQQGARKVTGARPDFGSLQMRVGLLPAAYGHQDEIVHGLEMLLDKLAAEQGF